MHCLCARWLDDGEPVLLCTKPTAKSKYSLYRSVLCWQVKNEHDDQFSEELFPFCGGVTEVGWVTLTFQEEVAWPGVKQSELHLLGPPGVSSGPASLGRLTSLTLGLFFCEMGLITLDFGGCQDTGRRSEVLSYTVVMAGLASFHQMRSWALQAMKCYTGLFNFSVLEIRQDLLTLYSQCGGRLGGGRT